MNGNVEIIVTPHSGKKCPRCWHYHYLADTPDGMCDRCLLVLKEDRQFSDEIKLYFAAERKKWCIRQKKDGCNKINCCMD